MVFHADCNYVSNGCTARTLRATNGIQQIVGRERRERVSQLE
jgi:hypothetical protein